MFTYLSVLCIASRSLLWGVMIRMVVRVYLYLLDDISQIADIWDNVTKIVLFKGYSVINEFLERSRTR